MIGSLRFGKRHLYYEREQGNKYMREMSLHNIAASCGGMLHITGTARLNGVTEETEVTSAVLDSRKAEQGCLFFATIGERVDGHRFIGQVFEKGASCVITQKTPKEVEEEHGISASVWGAYILVEDTFQALKDAAEFYRSTLNIPVVGITGSVGKTSTKEFIAGVLAQKYKVLKTEGNFNNEVGLPLTLLRIREEHEAAVVEMGISDFGEMHRLSKMARPTVCVITNIGQCHLENLKTRDGILKAKTEIFDYMDGNGEVCLNGDDDKLCTVTEVNGKRTHFFGLGNHPKEEVFAADIVNRGLFGSDAVLYFRDGISKEETAKERCDELRQPEQLPVHVPLPGAHMVINAAAAACVGRLLGLDENEIREGIAAVTPVGGRSHLISTGKYTLIDDCYNANPVSMKAAVDLLNTADTRKAAVLGDMFELGVNSDNMHEEVGAYAAKAGLDTIICIGENSSSMYRGACREQKSGQKILYFASKQEFLEKYRKAEEELFCHRDTILIKASHGMGFTEIVELLQ